MDLVDRATLEQLHAAVGIEAVREIAEALRSTLEEFLAEIDELDHDGLASRAHALKGSTSYLGTVELNRLAVAADRTAKAGGDVRTALQELAATIPGSMQELDTAIAALAEP